MAFVMGLLLPAETLLQIFPWTRHLTLKLPVGKPFNNRRVPVVKETAHAGVEFRYFLHIICRMRGKFPHNLRRRDVCDRRRVC
jgi:hypothetical protein